MIFLGKNISIKWKKERNQEISSPCRKPGTKIPHFPNSKISREIRKKKKPEKKQKKMGIVGKIRMIDLEEGGREGGRWEGGRAGWGRGRREKISLQTDSNCRQQDIQREPKRQDQTKTTTLLSSSSSSSSSSLLLLLLFRMGVVKWRKERKEEIDGVCQCVSVCVCVCVCVKKETTSTFTTIQKLPTVSRLLLASIQQRRERKKEKVKRGREREYW